MSAPCGLCNEGKPCQLMTCFHSICPSSIEAYAYSKVMGGQINIKCPISTCGKMVPSSLILRYLSLEANVMFNESLKNHFLSSKAKEDKSSLIHVEMVLATLYKLYSIAKGFATKIWRNKMSFFASSLLIVFFCHFFCVGNSTSCAMELLFMNSLALVFNLWGNLMKTLAFCLLYKLVQMPTYTAWVVGVLSIICTAYVIINVVGGSLLLITRSVLRMF